MIGTTLLSCITGGFSIGLGCGTCCSPAIGLFLSTYIVSHANNIRKALKAFISFFLGKTISVVLLCVLSSYLGNKFIFKDGYIGAFNLNKVMGITFIALGIYLIFNYFKQKYNKDKSCSSCKGSCSPSFFENKELPPLIVGMVYGISPCAPLILIIGYASTISIVNSALLGLCFSIASTISPLILVILLAGAISNNLYQELPKYIDIFKLMCYVVLVIVGIASL